MTDIFGVNHTKEFINVPSERAAAGEVNGRVKCLFDEVAAGAGLDVLFIGKLPKGARILRCSNIGGNSPTFNVSPGAKLSAETTVSVTLGAAPTFPVQAWVEFLMD
jgi:hypothetical protein